MSELQDILTALNDKEEVEYAEPLYLRNADAVVPSDPDYRNQWWLQALGCEDAWETTTGSSELVIAVLDSGIVPGHPDLADRLVQGADFVSNVENSGDGDARDAITVQNSIEILPGATALLSFNVDILEELSGIQNAEIVIASPGLERRIRVITHHGDWLLDTMPYFYVTAESVDEEGGITEYYPLQTTSTNAANGYEFTLNFWGAYQEVVGSAYAFFNNEGPAIFSGERGPNLLLTHSQVIENYNVSISP